MAQKTLTVAVLDDGDVLGSFEVEVSTEAEIEVRAGNSN